MALFGLFGKKAAKALKDIEKAVDLIDEEKWDDAIDLLTEPAHQGYVWAIYYAAVCYTGKGEYDSALSLANMSKENAGSGKELEKMSIELISDIEKRIAEQEEINKKRKLENLTKEGSAAFRSGKIDEAINLWKEPAEKNILPAMTGLIQAYAKKGNYDEALKWMDKIPFYNLDENKGNILLDFREYCLAKKYEKTELGQKVIKLHNRAYSGEKAAMDELINFYLYEGYDEFDLERQLGRKWIIEYQKHDFGETSKLFWALALKDLDAVDDNLALARKIKTEGIKYDGKDLDEEFICKHYLWLTPAEKEFLEGISPLHWDHGKLWNYYDVRIVYFRAKADKATDEADSKKWREEANKAIALRNDLLEFIEKSKDIIAEVNEKIKNV